MGNALGEAFAQGFGKAFNGLLPSSIAGNGWEVLHTFDILLLAGALAVAAIAVFGDTLGVDRTTAARLMRLAGVALGALVVYKMVDRTGPHEFVKLAAGPWVALAGCVLMTAGGDRRLARQRLRAGGLRAAGAALRSGLRRASAGLTIDFADELRTFM